MLLKDWLKHEGRKLLWLSNITNIKMQRLSGISTGRIEPRLTEVSTIFDATGGQVTWYDHLEKMKARDKNDI